MPPFQGSGSAGLQTQGLRPGLISDAASRLSPVIHSRLCSNRNGNSKDPRPTLRARAKARDYIRDSQVENGDAPSLLNNSRHPQRW